MVRKMTTQLPVVCTGPLVWDGTNVNQDNASSDSPAQVRRYSTTKAVGWQSGRSANAKKILSLSGLLILLIGLSHQGFSQATICAKPANMANFGVDGDLYANS